MLYIILFFKFFLFLLYNRWECHILLHIFLPAVHSKTRNPQRESPAVQSAKNSFHSDNNSIYRNFSQVHHHDVYTSLDLGPRSLRLSSFLHPTKLSRLSYYSCVSGREELFSFHIQEFSQVHHDDVCIYLLGLYAAKSQALQISPPQQNCHG